MLFSRIIVKIIKWLIFDIVVGIGAIYSFKLLILFGTDTPNILQTLLSSGELLLVAILTAAKAFGELLFGINSENSLKLYTKIGILVGLFFFIFGLSMLYGSISIIGLNDSGISLVFSDLQILIFSLLAIFFVGLLSAAGIAFSEVS